MQQPLETPRGRQPTLGDASAPLTRSEERRARRRGGLAGELWLALPPALTVVAVVALIQGVTSQRLLFASLAGSAFLIYYDPLHRMNAVRVMATAQILACLVGLSVSMLLGPGYLAGALAMALTILALIALDIMHPPAISTSIAFAFVPGRERTVLLFIASIAMLGALVLLQRVAVWTLHRIQVLGWMD